MNDNASWDDWLIGTWNSGDQMYEFVASSIFNQTSTYGGTIHSGDTITFDFIDLGSVAGGDFRIFINSIQVYDLSTGTAGETDGITFSVNPGDSVQLELQGGCCVYDFNIKIRPAAPPGAFWQDFVGCHES